jgi:hypothetical protein
LETSQKSTTQNYQAGIRMTTSKNKLYHILECTFRAGCNCGYAVEHDKNVMKQELDGFDDWVSNFNEFKNFKTRKKYSGK